MKRTPPLLVIGFTCLFVWSGWSQRNAFSGDKNGDESDVAIGISLGTKSFFGLDVAFKVAPNLSMKVAYNFFDLVIRDYESNFGYEHYVSVDAEMYQSSLEVLAEKMLFERNLRVVFGFGYFPVNRFKGKVILRDGYQFNDIFFTPEELGGVGGTLTFKSPVSPYIGIAFGNAIPKKKWGFSVNIGTFYKGRPQVEVVGTSLLRHNDINGKAIQNGISSYRWWPVLSFRVAYRLNDKSQPPEPIAFLSGKKKKSKKNKARGGRFLHTQSTKYYE